MNAVGYRFVLTGSSVRKLRQSGTNLSLSASGGPVLRYKGHDLAISKVP